MADPGHRATGTRLILVGAEPALAGRLRGLLRDRLRDRLRDGLRCPQYQVLEIADTVEQALNVAERERPDLAVIDIRSANPADEIDVADQMYRRLGIPAVLLAADAEPKTLDRAIAAKPFGIVLKPFRDQELLIAVATALDRHRVERDLHQTRLSKRAMLCGIGEAAIALDRDERIRYLNPCAETLLGWSMQQALGKPANEVLKLRDESGGDILAQPLREWFGAADDGQRRCFSVDHNGAETEVVLTRTHIVEAGDEIGFAVTLRDISEAQRADTRFRNLLEAAPDAMLITGTDGRIQLANAQAERLFGYDRRELLGKCVESLMPTRFRSQHVHNRAEFAAAPQTRAMGSGLDLYALTKDGTEVPVEISLSLLETEQGALVSAAIRDISAQRRDADQIRRLNLELECRVAERTARLVRAEAIAHLGGWNLDLRSNRLTWSEETYHIFGVAADETLTYDKFLTLIHPQDRDRVAARWEACLNGAGYDVEHRIVTGGQVKWVRERAELVRDSNGVVIGAEGAVQDITETKQAQQALRDSESRYRLLIEQAPDGIFLADTQGRYLTVNPAGAEMMGYTIEEIVGMRILDLLLPEETSRLPDEIARFADGRVTATEWNFKRKDGSVFCGEVVGRQLPDGRLQAIVRDITARKDLQASLVAARDDAQAMARARSRFLANMSHEIRTPLNGILGLARIGHRDSTGRTSRDAFKRILDAGSHLLGVINDILDISKIEAGKLSLDTHPFEFARVIDSVSDFVAHAAQDKGLTQRVELPPDLPRWVLGDAQRLRQVLANLLSNAVKFTERGEVRLRVTRQGTDTGFEVSDTGVGMAEEQIARLFEPFEQLNARVSVPHVGTGLGLAISRNLVRLMGGTIEVESRPGLGSRFRFQVPLPEHRPDFAQAPPPGPTLPRLVGLRVLAAEDVETNRLVLEDLLVQEGAQVAFAGNGVEALDLLAQEGSDAFDLVLMDMQMPVMDGYQATRRITKMAPGLPVIGCTAHALGEEVNECLDAGVRALVTKPIEVERLVTEIRRHVTQVRPGHPSPAPAAAAADDDLAGLVDWAALHQRFNGRENFIAKLAEAVYRSHRDSAAKLRQAARGRDLSDIAFVAHSLKGSSGNLMARSVHALAAKTEAAANAELDDAILLAAELADLLDRLLAEIAASRD